MCVAFKLLQLMHVPSVMPENVTANCLGAVVPGEHAPHVISTVVPCDDSELIGETELDDGVADALDDTPQTAVHAASVA